MSSTSYAVEPAFDALRRTCSSRPPALTHGVGRRRQRHDESAVGGATHLRPGPPESTRLR
jgi:hypothetical protein